MKIKARVEQFKRDELKRLLGYLTKKTNRLFLSYTS
jgi:hypothetical protein